MPGLVQLVGTAVEFGELGAQLGEHPRAGDERAVRLATGQDLADQPDGQARRQEGADLADGLLGGRLVPELSTASIVFAVRLAIQEVPDRTVFGSDAPYGDPVLTRAFVERVTPPGELRDRVLGGTFAELLGL